MTEIDTPQSRCRAGLAHVDITPPVGIYHRLWGAALHDRATGVHRPLRATALWLEALDGTAEQRQLILALDHCLLDRAEVERIAVACAEATGVQPGQVRVTMSHTHAAGWMSRSRAELPGGDLIGPYLDLLPARCADCARTAAASARPATFVYGSGRCALAAQRDYWDSGAQRYVCGFNPAAVADDTVLVARISADTGTVGTLVNYACHPTTLAWENSAISPDYVGAMRELIEAHTGAPCLFLQGASGDLGPREGFVGDPAVADRNGRQLGHAALAALESLPPPGTRFRYAGAVVSGAVIGSWRHESLDAAALARHADWRCCSRTVELPYRHDLPTREESERQLAFWQAEEDKARAADDVPRLRDCRARVEQMRRQLVRLSALPSGMTYPYRISVLGLGAALWVLVPGELYQVFQTTIRQRFPRHAVIVATLSGDWQPGYLPTAASYGYGIYQESIAVVAPGSLEVLIEAVTRELHSLCASAAALVG
jgi:hypothetical protein